MSRLRATAVAVGAGLLLGASPGAGGTVVTGSEQSTLLLPQGIRVEEYANDGYRMTIDGDSVLVEVSTAALGSTAPVPRPRPLRAEDSGVARIARGVAAGARTQFEAVSRVLSWVARQIRYELDRAQPQDPESVLARRSAYCTGVARLTVAMLRTLGIEAREVAGYVLASSGAGGEFHRWVEVRYPDRGWVFSDPLRSHHFVPASYLRLAEGRAAREASANALVLTRLSTLREVDLAAGVPQAVRVRANDARQRFGALRVEVEPPEGQGVLILAGSHRRWEREVDATRPAAFLGLEPGEYSLEWRAGGRSVSSRQLRFWGPVQAEVRLVAGEEPAARGIGER